jgi:hypothetical protein
LFNFIANSRKISDVDHEEEKKINQNNVNDYVNQIQNLQQIRNPDSLEQEVMFKEEIVTRGIDKPQKFDAKPNVKEIGQVVIFSQILN